MLHTGQAIAIVDVSVDVTGLPGLHVLAERVGSRDNIRERYVLIQKARSQ
jgi:hypothetical protein